MYTDPGSGLLFTQIVGAAVLTVVFRFRRRLADLLGRVDRPNSKSDDEDA